MVQLDIKTAFLYGELDEEIYLEQPEGYVAPGQEKLVCRLHKCLYGLKQASRVWNRLFDTFLKQFGLQPSDADPCLYTRRQEGDFLMVIIWVDDGLVCGSNNEVVQQVIEYLGKHFAMRSSSAESFVGILITRDRKQKTLYLSQPDYTKKVIRRFHMSDCFPKKIPAYPGSHLSQSQSLYATVDVPYKEAIGCLMYLMLVSRPDIAYAVNQASQFCERPGSAQWEAVKRILAYLQETSTFGIRFGNARSDLTGFSDSDYAGNVDTRQSTSGFVFMLNGGPVAWSSRRQSCVALSTTEAEFIAACEATKEGVWLQRLVSGIMPQVKIPFELLCDNQSAIRLIKNPEFHQRSKHIAVRYHFIRDLHEAGTLTVRHISTDLQVADSFTKALPFPRFSNLRGNIGVLNVPPI